MVLGKIMNLAGDFLKSADFEIKGDMKVGDLQERFEARERLGRRPRAGG